MDLELKNPTPEEVSDGTTALFTPEKQDTIFRRMNDLFDRYGRNVTMLSRVTDISERTISRYFSGKTKDPHFYTLCTMIIAMGGDVNQILGITPTQVIDTEDRNPYGQLIESYRNEAQTLRAALNKITADLDALTARISHAHKLIAIRTIALIVVISIFCALEIIDLCNPSWGRYQWALDLFRSFLHKV